HLETFGTALVAGRHVGQLLDALGAGDAEDPQLAGIVVRDELARPLHGGVDPAGEKLDRGPTLVEGDMDRLIVKADALEHGFRREMGERAAARSADPERAAL